MNKWLAVIGGVIIVIGAVVVFRKSFHPHYSGDLLTNEPGVIKWTAGQLRGDFVVKEGSPSVRSIKSHGTGGACYVADLEFADWPQNKNSGKYDGRCTENWECHPCKADGKKCNDKLKAFPDAVWVGYCVREDPSDADGKCWVKTGGDSQCNKSNNNGGAPWPIGQTQPMPNLITNIGYGIDANRINWRVLTCLFAIDPNDVSKDVGPCVESAERTGPSFKLP